MMAGEEAEGAGEGDDDGADADAFVCGLAQDGRLGVCLGRAASGSGAAGGFRSLPASAASTMVADMYTKPRALHLLEPGGASVHPSPRTRAVPRPSSACLQIASRSARGIGGASALAPAPGAPFISNNIWTRA